MQGWGGIEVSLSLYCSPYPALSVTSAAIFYDGGPSFPPMHENGTGDLLIQYSMAVIYTCQTSLHLKVQQPLQSQLLRWNQWNYPHWRTSPVCSYSRKLLTWLSCSPQTEVTVCFSGLGSSFHSAAQATKEKKTKMKKKTTTPFTKAWNRWPPLQGSGGQSTPKGRMGWRARRKHVPAWTSTAPP